jgi:hypothetical protein
MGLCFGSGHNRLPTLLCLAHSSISWITFGQKWQAKHLATLLLHMRKPESNGSDAYRCIVLNSLQMVRCQARLFVCFLFLSSLVAYVSAALSLSSLTDSKYSSSDVIS